MIYTKPTISTNDLSLKLVQTGGVNKMGDSCRDSGTPHSSNGAYEVDE